MKKMICLALMLAAPLGWGWAANKKVTLDVDQMTCPLCVISINKALRSTDGVIKAKASMKTHQADVIVPSDFDSQKLLAAIAQTGFSAKIHEETEIK
ncbi:heavy metal transporter [Erwinia sp. CPCC 100877]|nr:heavy metal transporter [Erwinia sp. CPCC 100877]